MGVAWVGFAEASPSTTWTPTTPGARHGRPEATLTFKTTPGLTLPSLAALPFTVAGRCLSVPVLLPLCLPPTPWDPSEAGQEPPRPLGPGSRLPPRILLRHPPLQSPRLKWAPLSSGAGKINNAASLNTPSKLRLTSHWYTGMSIIMSRWMVKGESHIHVFYF